jgi:hypothetical protein
MMPPVLLRRTQMVSRSDRPPEGIRVHLIDYDYDLDYCARCGRVRQFETFSYL